MAGASGRGLLRRDEHHLPTCPSFSPGKHSGPAGMASRRLRCICRRTTEAPRSGGHLLFGQPRKCAIPGKGGQRYSPAFRTEMIRLVRAGRSPEQRCPRRTGSDRSGRHARNHALPGEEFVAPRSTSLQARDPPAQEDLEAGIPQDCRLGLGLGRVRHVPEYAAHPPRSRVQQDGRGTVTVGVELGRDRGTRESDPVGRPGVAVIPPLTPASTPVSPARLPPRLRGR